MLAYVSPWVFEADESSFSVNIRRKRGSNVPNALSVCLINLIYFVFSKMLSSVKTTGRFYYEY